VTTTSHGLPDNRYDAATAATSAPTIMTTKRNMEYHLCPMPITRPRRETVLVGPY
jgi:hypothetical protein